MITFRQYSLEEAQKKEAIAAGVINLDAKGHPSTHLNNKPEIVLNEEHFLKQNNSINNEGMVLGVCGNSDGWNQHVEQYMRLGFEPDKVVICEYKKQFFWHLLGYYIRSVAGLKMNGNVNVITIKDVLLKNNIDCGIDDLNQNIYYIKAQGHPFLVHGAIDTRGVNIPHKGQFGWDLLSNALGGFIGPDNVTHIDFDITSTPKSLNHISDEAGQFFKFYRKINTLVQVYSVQRGLSFKNQVHEKEAEKEFNTDFAHIFKELQITDNRIIDGIYEVLYRIRSGKPQVIDFAEELKNNFKTKGIGFYFQVYPGANGPAMISISSIRNNKNIETVSIDDTIGTSNINIARRLANKLRNSDININGKYDKQITRLDDIVNNFS